MARWTRFRLGAGRGQGTAAALAVLVAGLPGAASGTLYCNRTYAELTLNAQRPYNAVGYLNNGCTAFLVGPSHIGAAAHCFVDGKGRWQKDLRFYPNFHPDRVTADDAHVPRADVARVVVGSRFAGPLGWGSDWAVAKLENWRDVSGMDLTPLPLAPSLPAVGTPLVNPSYTRHHFPYDDNDAVTWDNMEWDDTLCGWVKPKDPQEPGAKNGQWVIVDRPAPRYDGVSSDRVECNSRWGAGMIHADCSLAAAYDGLILHDCDAIGGYSGSPVLYQDSGGVWRIIGAGSGGGTKATESSNFFNQQQPQCTPPGPNVADNRAVSVERFRDAPWFASNVAIFRSPTNKSATAVFAVDADRDQVAYRSRTGAAPSYNGPFEYWRSLGNPPKSLKASESSDKKKIRPGRARLTRIAACAADAAARPQVFVVTDNEFLSTRAVQPNGSWGPWENFTPGSQLVYDVDASTDEKGRCQLFMVLDGWAAFTRRKISDTAWGNWEGVAPGQYKAISALRVGGTLWAVMVDTAGDLWRSSQGPAGWSTAEKLPRPGGVGAWRDVDLTWDEHARGFLVAIPQSPGNRLWFLPLYGGKAWQQWRYFDTHLWAPGMAAQDAPALQSITASRWMEDPHGTTSPLIFATDDFGNIYFIEYARVGTPGWVLDWKSFYHESIPY